MASKVKTKATKAPPEFPETAYLIKFTDGDVDHYLVEETAADVDDEQSDTGNVAVYKLERVGKKIVTIS